MALRVVLFTIGRWGAIIILFAWACRLGMVWVRCGGASVWYTWCGAVAMMLWVPGNQNIAHPDFHSIALIPHFPPHLCKHYRSQHHVHASEW